MLLAAAAALGYYWGDSTERSGSLWTVILIPILGWMALIGLIFYLWTNLLGKTAKDAPGILTALAGFARALGEAIIAPLAPLLKVFV